MKILRVISSMSPEYGGPCQGIRNSIPELSKIGVKNEVVCLNHPDSEFIKSDNFIVHALGKGIGPWNFNKHLLPWLINNLERFDAVIIHGIWLYHSYAVNKAVEKLKKTFKKNSIPKIFVMPHGMLDPYFQKAKGRKLKALRNWFYWKLIEGDVINNAYGLLYTCEVELQLAKVPFKPYHPKMEINIGYGISEPPPRNTQMLSDFLDLCPAIGNRPYLLFLSRIHEKKGVENLLNAYVQMVNSIWKEDKSNSKKSSLKKSNNSKSEQYDNLPLLVVAGPGIDSTYGEYLKEIADEINSIETLIIFPGMLNGNAKWGAFYGCEAFILPSHQENFGIAVVEAMACQNPVLISNQINIWQEITREKGGIVANDTLEGTLELFESWYKMSQEEKKEIGKRARRCYEKYFSIGPHAKKVLEALS